MIYGQPVLREKGRPVTCFDEALRILAQDMLETMAAANGIGLAAQQVGRTDNVCVIRIPPDALEESAADTPPPPMPLILVNPRITRSAGTPERDEEGCLSFPGIYAPVARPPRVELAYQDLEGQPRTLHAHGLLARCIQHELDHLNGVLLPDRIPAIKKVTLAARFKALKRETERTATAMAPGNRPYVEKALDPQ
ncbi:MAG: peptide deformylase [Candidatus Marinimicrobia bacterium]|nr:peptide deformylase [Candidatus Neomarinimicrobiota bacterium]